MKNFAPILLVLAATTASAQQITRVPLVLPTVNAHAVYFPAPSPALIPLSMPGSVTAEIAVPLSLPSKPSGFPVITPLELPGVKNPLPLPTPLIVKAVEVEIAAPALPVVDAVEAVKPARPALNELRDTVIGREPIRVRANQAFDGRRESSRESSLPSGRIF